MGRNSQWQPRLRFAEAADHRNIQQPHELVARFHTKLGHAVEMFDAKEVQYASTLLDRFPYDAVAHLSITASPRPPRPSSRCGSSPPSSSTCPAGSASARTGSVQTLDRRTKSCTYCGGSSSARIKPEHQGQAGARCAALMTPENQKRLKQYGSRLELPRQ